MTEEEIMHAIGRRRVSSSGLAIMGNVSVEDRDYNTWSLNDWFSLPLAKEEEPAEWVQYDTAFGATYRLYDDPSILWSQEQVLHVIRLLGFETPILNRSGEKIPLVRKQVAPEPAAPEEPRFDREATNA